MKVECPNCKNLFKCPEEYEGRKVKCKNCNEIFYAKPYQQLKIEKAKQSDNQLKEEVIAHIGQKYLTSIAVGAGLSSTSLTLTKNFLRGAGTDYSIKHKSSISFCGDVKNLTSIGVRYHSLWVLLLLGLVFLIAYGIGIIFILAYFFVKYRDIEINFQGVVYSLSMRGISNKEAEIFIDKVLETAREARKNEGQE